MVYRIFVEKRPGLSPEAANLLSDLKNFLGIAGLEGVRILNRYDAENITEELFDYAVKTGRTRVDVVTKANIIKATDGKFLRIFEEIAAE